MNPTYRRSIPATVASPTTSYFDDLALEEALQSASQGESESWLLSYIDVFLLIIAFLIIMLFKSPEQASTSIVAKAVYSETPATADILTNLNTDLKNLSTDLKNLSSDHRITVASNNRHISVRLDNTLLFDSSKAVIKPEGKKAIQQLIPTLKAMNKPLIIEGHTDSTPINTQLYPSNWELSAARANSVLHFLSAHGISKDQMSTANYADTRPLVPNDSSNHRSINRRVNLLIMVNEDVGNSDFKL